MSNPLSIPLPGSWQRLSGWLAAGLIATISLPALAASTNWGVIPLEQETTISFGASDITKNFTDQYAFTLGGSTESAYQVVASFDACSTGCGSPSLSYAIYDAQGSLVSDTGSAVLSSGNYVLKVKDTGMGAGNTVSYSGAITFFASASDLAIVSSVPEPADWMLLTCGGLLVLAAWRRKCGIRARQSSLET